MSGPGGAGIALPGEQGGDAQQHRRHHREHDQRQPSPPAGRGPFAQGGDEHNAPAGRQRQKREPVRVQIRQQAGEQEGQGKFQHQPPAPGPHHRPAHQQGQRRQRQEQENPDGGGFLLREELPLVQKDPAPVHPLGKLDRDVPHRDARALRRLIPEGQQGAGPQGGQPSRRRILVPGQGPHRQHDQGKHHGAGQKFAPVHGAEVQRRRLARQGVRVPVQREEGPGKPRQSAQQEQRVPDQNRPGKTVFLIRHGRPLLPG